MAQPLWDTKASAKTPWSNEPPADKLQHLLQTCEKNKLGSCFSLIAFSPWSELEKEIRANSANSQKLSSHIKTVIPVFMLFPMLQSHDAWKTNGLAHTEDNVLRQWQVTSRRSRLSFFSCGSEQSPADFPSSSAAKCLLACCCPHT